MINAPKKKILIVTHDGRPDAKIESELGENAEQYFSEIKSSWNRFKSFPVLEFAY